MKHMRKLFALVLAVVLVMSLATTAFAASGTNNSGSITINNAVKGETYTIYQLLVLESYNNETNAYSYKIDSDWTNFFNQTTIKDVYVNIDANGYVTWVENADAAAFAQAALKYATDNSVAGNGTVKATSETVSFTGLNLGYYLVDSSLGALCNLTTTVPSAEVNEKNAGHTLDKDVKEGSAWGDKSDADIGDTVEFKATITISGTVIDLVMHDTMSSGLTYSKVSSVTLNGATVETTNYEVKTSTTDGCTFEVVFTKTFNDSLNNGDVIVVYYEAVLNENAVVAEEETNNAHLTYKDTNGNEKKTEDSTTKTFTWKIDVLKYANGDTSKVLAGAKFKLSTDAEGNDVIKLTKTATNVYEVAANGTVTEITTDATGKFTINGLDSGTYYLTETDAPAGYNKLNTVVEIKVTEGTVSVATTTDGTTTYTQVNEVQVNNNSGTELPTTGGMGTTLFYLLGGIMVLAAVVLLVTKKRMASAE